MNCKDCYHCKACEEMCDNILNWEEEEICDRFKDKSRIVELPVSVGQQVWFVRNGKIEEAVFEKVVLIHRGLHIKLGCNAMYETSCNSIGKTVFLTREEAEEALRKEQEK